MAGRAVVKDQSSNKLFILTAGGGSQKCKDGKDCQEDLSQFCLRRENDHLVAPTRIEIAEAEEKESKVDVELEEGSTVAQKIENNNTAVMEKLQATSIDNNNITMTEKQENFNRESTLIHDGKKRIVKQ